MIPAKTGGQIHIYSYMKENGTGLGFSLSKQIMLKMEGNLLLNHSKENKTTFSFIYKSLSLTYKSKD